MSECEYKVAGQHCEEPAAYEVRYEFSHISSIAIIRVCQPHLTQSLSHMLARDVKNTATVRGI